jgi:DNA-binding CsgD family transcriptional regulator
MTFRRGRPRYDDILTPREWQVLALLEAGLTNEQIAERLGISFGTAKYHVGEIISKLGVTTREEAVVAARRTAEAGRPRYRSGCTGGCAAGPGCPWPAAPRWWWQSCWFPS